MSLTIPPKTFAAMRDAHASWAKLLSLGSQQNVWTSAQKAQLSEISSTIKHLHNALDALIDANNK